MGLILTRRVGETVEIGPDIRVTVIGVRGNQVRIWFEVPTHITVHREEIADRIREQEKKAPPAADAPAGPEPNVNR